MFHATHRSSSGGRTDSRDRSGRFNQTFSSVHLKRVARNIIFLCARTVLEESAGLVSSSSWKPRPRLGGGRQSPAPSSPLGKGRRGGKGCHKYRDNGQLALTEMALTERRDGG